MNYEEPLNTLISVIVPCHNEEETLEECLRSIFNSTFPEDITTEVIVINDRSRDRSVEIAKNFPVKLINKYESRAKNPIAETANLGIKQAKGDYIAFIEADMKVERQWLIKLFPHFREKNIGVVSGYILVDPRRSWINKLYYLMHRRFFLRSRDRNEVLSEEIFPKAGFSIFRREVFENVSFFNESIRAIDIMLYLKVRAYGYRYVCDMSAVAYDIRRYTSTKLIQTSINEGIAMYQTGGSLLYMHEQLLFRYIVLSPHYITTLFRSGRSLVSIFFPIFALIKYISTVIGYFSAVLRKEQKCEQYLRKKRRENEIRWMLNSFKREITRFGSLVFQK